MGPWYETEKTDKKQTHEQRGLHMFSPAKVYHTGNARLVGLTKS